MITAAVEQYTGEGEPPYCEMTLRAADNYDRMQPFMMIQPVTLNEVRGSNKTFTIERALEASEGILYAPSAVECPMDG